MPSWIHKLCGIIVFGHMFRGFGPSFFLLWGSGTHVSCRLKEQELELLSENVVWELFQLRQFQRNLGTFKDVGSGCWGAIRGWGRILQGFWLRCIGFLEPARLGLHAGTSLGPCCRVGELLENLSRRLKKQAHASTPETHDNTLQLTS